LKRAFFVSGQYAYTRIQSDKLKLGKQIDQESDAQNDYGKI
jgi:hypothetical protein